MTIKIRQSVCKMPGMCLELVPPLAPEFHVYGGKDTLERAREWALWHHYVLVEGLAKCAHGLYLLDMCPGQCYSDFRRLDHVNLWVPADLGPDDRPFILSHPYRDVDERTRTYAQAHGLDLLVDMGTDAWNRDDWYGPNTHTIKMQISSHWLMWPIEMDSTILLRACPVRWPDVSDEA